MKSSIDLFLASDHFLSGIFEILVFSLGIIISLSIIYASGWALIYQFNYLSFAPMADLSFLDWAFHVSLNLILAMPLSVAFEATGVIGLD